VYALTVVAAALSWPALASAQGADGGGPSLEILNAEDADVTVSGDQASVDLIVKNAGDAATGELSFELVQPELGSTVSLTPTEVPVSVDPGDIETISLEGTYDEARELEDGILTISDGDGLLAQALVESSLESNYRHILLPILLGLLVAVAVVLAAAVNSKNDLKTDLPAKPGWDFSTSWASNLVAIGAVLGTILGSSEIAASAFEGVPLVEFVALNVIFGVIGLLAPVVFTVCRRKDNDGTTWGFLVASGLTTLSVGGQMLTVLALFATADRGPTGARTWVACAAVFIGLAVVGIAAARTIRWRLQTPPAGVMTLL
jgi:hypothetical protein